MSIDRFTAEQNTITMPFEDFLSEPRMIEILKKRRMKGLRPMQALSIDLGLFFRQNFLICTASGSGKTLIGEMAIAYTIFRGIGKGIYLVPYKAIAIEKYHMFRTEYGPYGIKVVLSMGDNELDADELIDADIIVTTYEKMDSLLRSAIFGGMKWTNQISTVVIDEIHVMGEQGRGPRLESLIVRLTERPNDLQIIALSATIANPDFFASWLGSLGKEFAVIQSDYRPIPLQYDIQISTNKDGTVKKIVKENMEKAGQVLIFLNRRSATISTAEKLGDLTEKYLDEENKRILEKSVAEMKKQPYSSKKLQALLLKGIGFHNASLDREDKLMVEKLFESRNIKVIACTTTLSAGVNTPARHVILRNFEQYVPNIFLQTEELHYEPEFEVRPGKASVFIPVPNNQLFQILGRAGRPGKDSAGIGTILVGNQDEADWVVGQYFHYNRADSTLHPKYGALESKMNSLNVLQEQILLLICQLKSIKYQQIINFLKKTYFYYSAKAKNVPIDQLLRIRAIEPETLLEMHFTKEKITDLDPNTKMDIQNATADKIEAILTVKGDAKLVSIDSTKGFFCTCNHYKNNQILGMTAKVDYNFCIHFGMFLYRLSIIQNKNLRSHIIRLIELSMKDSYVLRYLIDNELVYYDRKTQILKPTEFGLMSTKLFITPKQFVWLRKAFENRDLDTEEEILQAVFDYMSEQRDEDVNTLIKAIMLWIQEAPITEIERSLGFYFGLGDFNQIKANIIRTLSTFDAISDFFERDSVRENIKDLQLRLIHGIKLELIDLVVHNQSINRISGRKLFNAGYTTEEKISRADGQTLSKATGIPRTELELILQELRAME